MHEVGWEYNTLGGFGERSKTLELIGVLWLQQEQSEDDVHHCIYDMSAVPRFPDFLVVPLKCKICV